MDLLMTLMTLALAGSALTLVRRMMFSTVDDDTQDNGS